MSEFDDFDLEEILLENSDISSDDEAIELDPEDDAALKAFAEEMGLMEDDPIEETLVEASSEGKSVLDAAAVERAVTIIKLGKTSKLKSLGTRAAFAIAKNKKDPMYNKYIKLQRMRLELRGALLKKYGNQGKSSAKKILASRQQGGNKVLNLGDI